MIAVLALVLCPSLLVPRCAAAEC
eukprot:SAG11_NODE_37125_length_258_cov_0.880503_2_plen_23_part_01